MHVSSVARLKIHPRRSYSGVVKAAAKFLNGEMYDLDMLPLISRESRNLITHECKVENHYFCCKSSISVDFKTHLK